MVTSDEVESELSQLRSNADNLSQCLHALLERIEHLEAATGDSLPRLKNSKPKSLSIKVNDNENGADEDPLSDVQVGQPI